MKKVYQLSFQSPKLWGMAAVALAGIGPVIIIASCASADSELNQEVRRLEIYPWQTQPLTPTEFKQLNKSNLKNYINNWAEATKNTKFTYQVDNVISKSVNSIEFRLIVADASAPTQMRTTKARVLEFQILTEEPPVPDPAPGPSQPPNLETGWAPITNKDPATAKQYPIEHADKYHFNRPFYQNDQVTLKQNGSAANNVPSPGYPSQPNVYAKEGWIPSANHVQLAKQVFSVGFVNGTEQTGTAWILDYKLTDDESYPLTWYFGTNAHVIDDLRVDNEPIYKEKFATWDPVNNRYRAENTRRMFIYEVFNPQAQTEYRDSNSGGWDFEMIQLNDPSKEDIYWNKQEGYFLKNPPVKTIFQGFDFLSTSPSQFSAVNPWRNKEEYADFGVFELTFATEAQARKVTNNYAEWPEEQKFKYRSTDLVSHPEHTPKQVFEVGYPTDGAVRNVATNTNKLLFDQGQTVQTNALTQSPNYSTWTHVAGRFDAHIAMSDFGYSYEWMDNSQTDINKVKTSTPYVGYGLIYGAEGSNMRGGSSGALSVDQDGYAIGIHYASDNNSAMGGTQAFVSEGYDYKGYYGNYNLPAYDLIRGGGQLQKASYYDNMVKIYGKDPNFKTRLFPRGLQFRN